MLLICRIYRFCTLIIPLIFVGFVALFLVEATRKKVLIFLFCRLCQGGAIRQEEAMRVATATMLAKQRDILVPGEREVSGVLPGKLLVEVEDGIVRVTPLITGVSQMVIGIVISGVYSAWRDGAAVLQLSDLKRVTPESSIVICLYFS